MPPPHVLSRGSACFSISATRRPAWAQRNAATPPAGPAPITIASKCIGPGLAPSLGAVARTRYRVHVLRCRAGIRGAALYRAVHASFARLSRGGDRTIGLCSSLRVRRLAGLAAREPYQRNRTGNRDQFTSVRHLSLLQGLTNSCQAS